MCEAIEYLKKANLLDNRQEKKLLHKLNEIIGFQCLVRDFFACRDNDCALCVCDVFHGVPFLRLCASLTSSTRYDILVIVLCGVLFPSRPAVIPPTNNGARLF